MLCLVMRGEDFQIDSHSADAYYYTDALVHAARAVAFSSHEEQEEADDKSEEGCRKAEAEEGDESSDVAPADAIVQRGTVMIPSDDAVTACAAMT